MRQAFDLNREPAAFARPLWPQRAGPVVFPEPPAGRGGRQAGDGLLRLRRQDAAGRLGHARGQLPQAQGPPAAAAGPRRCPRCSTTCTSAAWLGGRWSWSWASSAARRASTARAGRDHWEHCYSVLLAGGGVRPGQVHGRSDRIGAYPAAGPRVHDPPTYAATVYHCLGIDPHAEIADQAGRPLRLTQGEPIMELF